MKILAVAVLLVAGLTGCSGRCRDKTGGFFVWDKAYRACGNECHGPEEKKPCGCSSACPCWKEAH